MWGSPSLVSFGSLLSSAFLRRKVWPRAPPLDPGASSLLRGFHFWPSSWWTCRSPSQPASFWTSHLCSRCQWRISSLTGARTSGFAMSLQQPLLLARMLFPDQLIFTLPRASGIISLGSHLWSPLSLLQVCTHTFALYPTNIEHEYEWLNHRWLSGKDFACNAGDAGDVGSVPELGSSPGEGNGHPLQYFAAGQSHGQRNLVGYCPWGRRVRHSLETEHSWLNASVLQAQLQMPRIR